MTEVADFPQGSQLAGQDLTEWTEEEISQAASGILLDIGAISAEELGESQTMTPEILKKLAPEVAYDAKLLEQEITRRKSTTE